MRPVPLAFVVSAVSKRRASLGNDSRISSFLGGTRTCRPEWMGLGAAPAKQMLQAGCGAPLLCPFLPLKMGTASGVKCSVGGGRQESKAGGHYRKVSAVEPSPGDSRLMSTRTQATFSWLLHKDKAERGIKKSIFKLFLQHYGSFSSLQYENNCGHESLSENILGTMENSRKTT